MNNILSLSVGYIPCEMKIKRFELGMLFACNILSVYDYVSNDLNTLKPSVC
jgi:hypothetical protein